MGRRGDRSPAALSPSVLSSSPSLLFSQSPLLLFPSSPLPLFASSHDSNPGIHHRFTDGIAVLAERSSQEIRHIKKLRRIIQRRPDRLCHRNSAGVGLSRASTWAAGYRAGAGRVECAGDRGDGSQESLAVSRQLDSWQLDSWQLAVISHILKLIINYQKHVLSKTAVKKYLPENL